MIVLDIEIPGLPKRTNNSQSSWRARMAESRKWKMLVADFVILGKRRPPKPLTKAKLTLTRRSSVRPDSDGLVSSFKHVIDGLIAAGVIANDRYENIGMPTYLWEKAPRNKGSIRIVVEEMK